MQSSQPHWMTLAGVFGLGAVVGNLVFFLLSSWWQRRSWINDNKKTEWRELIDALRESIRVMAYRYDSEMPYAISGADERCNEEAKRKGEIAIRDRIFISKKLQESGLFRQWVELVKEHDEADVSFKERPKILKRFIQMAHKFQDDLIRVSREDLGIERRRHWFHRGG